MSGGEGGINLTALSLDQLNQLRQSIEEVLRPGARARPDPRSRHAAPRRPRPPPARRAGDVWAPVGAPAAQGVERQAGDLEALARAAQQDAGGCVPPEIQAAPLRAPTRTQGRLPAPTPASIPAAPSPPGTRMLVPITSSLYVPGETTQLDNVLIDVGTGYYIEKSVRCAPRSERGAARETLTMRARGRRR